MTVSDAHVVEKRSDKECYLPRHSVMNTNKLGKVRRVLNGASKFHCTSLNKSLLTGPDLRQNLTQVLVRFCQHPLAVSADIEGLFLLVDVQIITSHHCVFLWREDTTTIVVLYQYKRRILGAKDSPICTNYAFQRTGRGIESQYP